MKKLRKTLEQCILDVECYWESLSRKRQRLLTVILFFSYVLATVLSTLFLWSDSKRENTGFPKNHIESIQKKSKSININQKLKE